MRVFLFISKEGDSLPIAQRIVEEGHRVIFYNNTKEFRREGDGLIEKSPVKDVVIDKEGNIDESIISSLLYPRPDCVVFDMVGYGFGKLADTIRKKGFPVIGGSQWADQVELDRPYGIKLMKMQGISVPKTFPFTDYPSAIRFVEETNKPYVYKPSGNQPALTTYVARTAGDLIGVLEYYSDEKDEFELQEIVEGVEISTEVWFNGKEVVGVSHTMEEKSLMEGGIGPNSGCMGDVVWASEQGCKLYKEGIGKMVPLLKKVDYRGPLDLNTIVTKDCLYGLEFTARFGYNALFTLMELYEGRINDLLYGVATGVTKTITLKPGWAISVTFAVEPFPLQDVVPDMPKDTLIQGVDAQNLRHIWWGDVYKKGDMYACAGSGGNLGVVTARSLKGGKDEYTIREAKRRVYRTVSNLIIPNVMYRRDIGDRVHKDVSQLEQWGWL